VCHIFGTNRKASLGQHLPVAPIQIAQGTGLKPRPPIEVLADAYGPAGPDAAPKEKP